jgi:hypothetical protein
MIGYEIYDRFTMEHFTLRQRMTLTQIKKIFLTVYAHVNKVSKNEKKMRINVIQHDDRLWNLRPFYNGAFYIDDQNLLLATVHNSK